MKIAARLRLHPALVVGLVIGIFIVGAPAMATNIAALDGGDSPVYRANNKYHWFAYAPTAGWDIVNGYEATRTQSYEGTDLVTSFHGTGVGDSNNWDIYVEKCYGCLPGSVLAQVDCRVFYKPSASVTRCSHWHAMNDGDQTDALSANGMQQLGCHETGHTVGLLHPRDGSTSAKTYGCMPTRVSFDGVGDKRWLQTHNTNHINAAY